MCLYFERYGIFLEHASLPGVQTETRFMHHNIRSSVPTIHNRKHWAFCVQGMQLKESFKRLLGGKENA